MKKLLSVTNEWIELEFGMKAGFVQFLIKEHKITTKRKLRKLLKNY